MNELTPLPVLSQDFLTQTWHNGWVIFQLPISTTQFSVIQQIMKRLTFYQTLQTFGGGNPLLGEPHIIFGFFFRDFP